MLVSGFIGIPPKTKKYSSDLSCKYEGKTLQVFAYRVHAHMHGDVNSAYRIRNHEWQQLAKGDPQWPQAFYPLDTTMDIKDGDALVGRCTYHNDETRVIYAGPTHNDEMCNVYLMYYVDDTTDVMDVCSGNTYPQLESIIPPEADRKPAPPVSFKTNQDNSKSPQGQPSDALSHHDMEGSKMHHEIPGPSNSNSRNKQKQSQKGSPNYFYNTEDYYDDVERGRSKGRNNNNNNNNNDLSLSNSDDAPFYDTNSLLEAINSDNAGSEDDLSLPDSASSLLLAAALSKINNNGLKNGNLKNNQLVNKMKSQLNNLLPQTITSKT